MLGPLRRVTATRLMRLRREEMLYAQFSFLLQSSFLSASTAIFFF
tara:strand:- start:478 stop:612 length:135 start_codon:yes stop_codon:yes gene_type:complete